jgi:hypothetical protein
MCVDDFARTVQFVRGVDRAVRELKESVGTRPVEVLYAGCGPLAPLAVPLMSRFGPHHARFTLLDIHDSSIHAVESLIKTLSLENCVANLQIADASLYTTTAKPDLIVIEMLRAALQSEPQVAVTRNLLRQAPDAVLIPQQVRVDLTLVDPRREHSTDGAPLQRDRVSIATVFRVAKETCDLPAVTVTLPDFDTTRYQPMLTTTIEIYQGIQLSDYDSGITLPKTLSALPAPGDTVEFSYETGSDPRVKMTGVS